MREAPDASDITQLLRAWRKGDAAAANQLAARVYGELRRMARRHMKKEAVGRTLQTTALVHELYLRLLGIQQIDWQDRSHFFAIAAHTMRRILVDAARARLASKRGGGLQREEHLTAVDLDRIPDIPAERDREIVAVDDALIELAQIDPRKARVIELRFFVGLSVEETGALLGISPQSVLRDWRLAKSWMARKLRP
jgi:RNA polymerase sigma factor (TIGR02999 family)